MRDSEAYELDEAGALTSVEIRSILEKVRVATRERQQIELAQRRPSPTASLSDHEKQAIQDEVFLRAHELLSKSRLWRTRIGKGDLIEIVTGAVERSSTRPARSLLGLADDASRAALALMEAQVKVMGGPGKHAWDRLPTEGRQLLRVLGMSSIRDLQHAGRWLGWNRDETQEIWALVKSELGKDR